MMQFFRDMAHNPCLLTGLCAALLASLACGTIGPYVIARRIVFLSGAIAHTAVAGIGAVVWLTPYLPVELAWIQPLHGALLAAVLGAVLIGLVHGRVDEPMDTLIGAMWAVGMATGILLIKFAPGYQTDLMSYLFGNITYVRWEQIQLMLGLCAVIFVTVLVFHKRLLAVCLDREQAELQGINVLATDLVLLCLVALTAICLTQVVGLILMIALLSLPAATAAHHVGRMSAIMVVSTLLAMAVTTLPRIAVYGTPIRAESAIVLTAAGVYLLSVLVGRVATAVR